MRGHSPEEDSLVLLDAQARCVYVETKSVIGRWRYFGRVVSNPRPQESIAEWFAGLVDVGQLPANALIRSYQLSAEDSAIFYFEP